MQTTNFDFENDNMLAKHAYAMAEKFIRSCESANTINSNNKLNSIKADSSLYDNYNADFDYFIVGKVCSLSENRQAHFTQFVETDSTDEQVVEMRQKREDGVMIKDLMKEYGLSKASVYRLMGTS